MTCCITVTGQENVDLRSTYSYTRKDGRKATVGLKRVNDSLYVIQYAVADKVCDEWRIGYPVYQFDCGDINGDSIPEIAVGVVKSTRYWHNVGRRLFIFKLFEEEVIRPLWLGSRVAHELLDFHLEQTPEGQFVRTKERNDEGKVVEIRYRSSGFGLKFVEYVTG